jgi:hypothetical protein
MIGTPEERYMKRRAERIVAQRKGMTLRTYGAVRPGTTALLNVLRKNAGMSMDEILYKLARMGQKVGV